MRRARAASAGRARAVAPDMVATELRHRDAGIGADRELATQNGMQAAPERVRAGVMRLHRHHDLPRCAASRP